MKTKIKWQGFVRVMIPFVFVTFLFTMFFQSCQKKEIFEPQIPTLKSATTIGTLTYFTTPEEFACTGLPMEDFEEATNAYPEGVYNPLDANTSTGFLPAGSILPGISFASSRDHGPYPAESPDLNIWAGINNIVGHMVVLNHAKEKIIIEFTDDNVMQVSMKLLTLFSNQATFDINIYGNSETLLGNIKIIGGTPVGTYFGVQSENPIKKITLYGFDHVYYGEEGAGVDDVMFGTCVVLDTDGDGINDDVDNCPNAANPNQEDLDADGLGDVCDNDIDGDGINNDVDNCPIAANPDQKDFDKDAIGDVCDDDIDGDGCLNSKDDITFSNMEAFVNIGGCSNGVENKMTSTCGTMMSDMLDALEAGTYKNPGQFVKAVTQLTKMWMVEGLITQAEQTLILACAGKSK